MRGCFPDILLLRSLLHLRLRVWEVGDLVVGLDFGSVLVGVRGVA